MIFPDATGTEVLISLGISVDVDVSVGVMSSMVGVTVEVGMMVDVLDGVGVGGVDWVEVGSGVNVLVGSGVRVMVEVGVEMRPRASIKPPEIMPMPHSPNRLPRIAAGMMSLF